MLKKQFAVLMSTYNGELFIKEQIDSILAQKDVDITLYIRDDGSNDNTVKLIKEYIKKYDCIRFMNDNNNLRPGASFMKLLLSVLKKEKKYDFYAFADQDDIWLENKVETLLNEIKKDEETN